MVQKNSCSNSNWAQASLEQMHRLQEEAGEAKAGDDDQCALPPDPAPSSGGNKVAGGNSGGGGRGRRRRLLPWGHGWVHEGIRGHMRPNVRDSKDPSAEDGWRFCPVASLAFRSLSLPIAVLLYLDSNQGGCNMDSLTPFCANNKSFSSAPAGKIFFKAAAFSGSNCRWLLLSSVKHFFQSAKRNENNVIQGFQSRWWKEKSELAIDLHLEDLHHLQVQVTTHRWLPWHLQYEGDEGLVWGCRWGHYNSHGSTTNWPPMTHGGTLWKGGGRNE